MPQPRKTTYGSLDCIVIDGGESPSIPVILCHGYGAPGTDLAGLAFEWISLLGTDAGTFRFVFPAAPLSLIELGMPDARAWWPINMAQLAEAMQTSKFSEMHDHQPQGLSEARSELTRTIELVRSELADASGRDAANRPYVLGGFSQGAMLTLDTVLRGDIDPPALLLLYSGTLICESEWTKSLTRLANTHIYQAHGTVDPILPFTSAMELSELLKQSGAETEFHAFNGPHTIDTESIVRTVERMKALL
ncbi:Phospholipase/Carboxylesterase [Novipirellula aureliae]|uniref:Phospholipase/Carboxylesterase n=1 Tax=Novipirellula aureliae TaxID=2527966 RepID=A0A5C6ED75_9BACT|nr:lysophospholipase [Novipirellula aureliae]TWU45169.1 Phospholipase/Carboxylesterase [Novipirellula aureliae]